MNYLVYELTQINCIEIKRLVANARLNSVLILTDGIPFHQLLSIKET